MEIKTLAEKDLQQIIQLEKQLLAKQVNDPMRAEMMAWKQSWREESLNHYLPSGWSMGFFDNDGVDLKGYFLAQPILFFRGLTQNLWIEHLRAFDNMNIDELVDVAYRLARSKHLQSVLFYNCTEYVSSLESRGAEKLMDDVYLIKTAKIMT